MYPACTFLGPFVYLRCTWGRLSARPCPRTAVVCPPSLSRAARAWRAEGASVLSADAVPVPLPGGHADARRASGPAGVQRLGLRHRERRHGGRRSQGTTACSALEGHQRALHAARPDSLAHVGRGDGHPNVVPRLYLSVMLPSGLTPNPHAPPGRAAQERNVRQASQRPVVPRNHPGECLPVSRRTLVAR
jgi:hypothetical protein